MNKETNTTKNEYLVTVYDTNVCRLGAYTVYFENREQVEDDWYNRREKNWGFFQVHYKGWVSF